MKDSVRSSTVAIRLTEKEKEYLEEIAYNEFRTVGNVIRKALVKTYPELGMRGMRC